MLTSQWIVTATHCLFDLDKNQYGLEDLTFIVGDYNSKSDTDDLGDFQEMILFYGAVFWYCQTGSTKTHIIWAI